MTAVGTEMGLFCAMPRLGVATFRRRTQNFLTDRGLSSGVRGLEDGRLVQFLLDLR